MPISKPRLELLVIFLLLAIAIFFRFWQIREYVVFLGDEGRDMIVMRDIFTQGNLPFLGPTASVGGFYLGPIYYWMAAPFLLLSAFDPVGPSYMVALFGVATVFLLYKFLKEVAGFWPAISASLLYAIAPLIVRYSRSSWNPNPLPFFALLIVYSLYMAIKTKKSLFFLIAGASLGIAIQLHYLAIILAPIATLIVIASGNFKILPKAAFFSLAGFIITFSPFLFFEIRHNFPNFRTILEFTSRGSTVGLMLTNLTWSIPDIGNILFQLISSYNQTIFTRIAFLILTIGSTYLIFTRYKNKEKLYPALVAIIWFFAGLFFLRTYRGQLYDYYFGALFPAPFFLAGVILSEFGKNAILKTLAFVTVIALVFAFVSRGFYTSKPNNLINQTENIADFVIEKSQNQPYNFALVSESNSDHAYRYFLELKNKRPTKLEEMVSDQLLIICESPCSPLGHPLWEIAAFGRAEISEEWDLPQYNFKIYRLTHWPGEPSPAGKPAVKGI